VDGWWQLSVGPLRVFAVSFPVVVVVVELVLRVVDDGVVVVGVGGPGALFPGVEFDVDVVGFGPVEELCGGEKVAEDGVVDGWDDGVAGDGDLGDRLVGSVVPVGVVDGVVVDGADGSGAVDFVVVVPGSAVTVEVGGEDPAVLWGAVVFDVVEKGGPLVNHVFAVSGDVIDGLSGEVGDDVGPGEVVGEGVAVGD